MNTIANTNLIIGDIVPNKIAASASVDQSAILGRDVAVMEHAVIRANVHVSDRSVIGPYCIVGEYQSGFYEDPNVYQNPPTEIGPESIIRSHSIIYSGTILGKGFRSGHHIIVRENSSFGDFCLFGNFCQTDEAVQVKDYVRCHSRVFLASGMEIGAYSCLYPNVTTTDVRYPPYRNKVAAPKIGERVVVGAGVVLLSGICVGEDAFIAAGSLVSSDISAGMFAIGRPARVKKPVEKILVEDLEIENPYPFDPTIIRNWERK